VSDHHHVKITIMLHDHIKKLKEGNNSSIRLKIKWEKVDIDLYKALTYQSIDALNKTTRTLNDTERLTEKICTIMNEAATTVKAKYSVKLKLKVWTPKIKDLLENMRSNYKQCVTYGKPTNPTNIIYSQRILSRKDFGKAMRIEEAIQRILSRHDTRHKN
jgi:hypothetical protein